jgi:3-oxoadipate enol-lactonase
LTVPQLVLLHPIGLDSQCWVWAGLPEAIPLDLPGHGDRALSGERDLADVADTVVAAVDGPLDLVGVSLGGAVAQQIAVRHPARVRSAVFACTSPATRTEVLLARAEELERDGVEASLPPTLERWFSPDALAQPDHPGVAYARRRLLADDPAMLSASWRMLAGHDLRRELTQLRLPVTVILAAEDKGTPRSAVDELHGLVPGAVLEVVLGPHMVHIEQGPLFAAAVRRHLLRAADG